MTNQLPQILDQIRNQPGKKYEGVPFKSIQLKDQHFLYYFSPRFVVPVMVESVDYHSLSAKIHYETLTSQVQEYVRLSCLRTQVFSQSQLNQYVQQLSDASFRIDRILKKNHFPLALLTPTIQEMKRIYSEYCKFLGPGNNKAEDARHFIKIGVFEQFISNPLADVQIIRYQPGVVENLQKLNFELEEFFENLIKFDSSEQIADELSILLNLNSFTDDFCSQDYVSFKVKEYLELIFLNEEFMSSINEEYLVDMVVSIYKCFTASIKNQLNCYFINCLELFFQHPGDYINIPIEIKTINQEIEQFEQKIISSIISRFQIPFYVPHCLHKINIPIIQEIISTFGHSSDQILMQLIDTKFKDIGKILSLANVYGAESLIENDKINDFQDVDSFLSFQVSYDIHDERFFVLKNNIDEVYNTILGQFVIIENQIENIQNFDDLKPVIEILYQILPIQQYYGVTFDLTFIILSMKNQFDEKLNQIYQNNNSSVVNQLQNYYIQIQKSTQLITQDPQTPDLLVKVIEELQVIDTFIPEIVTSLNLLFLTTIESSQNYLQAEDFDFSAVYQSLIVLKKEKCKVQNLFSVKQRVFSKFTLNLADLVHFYSSQLDLVIKDIILLPSDVLDDRNDVLFKRKYRWISTNLNYDQIEDFFEQRNMETDLFIQGVKNGCGVDLNQIENQKYTREGRVDLDKVFQELIWLLDQVCKVSTLLEHWSTVLGVECFLVLHPQNLQKEIQPIIRILLGFKVFQTDYQNALTQKLNDFDSERLLSAGEEICKSLKFIKQNQQYKSWVSYSENLQPQLISILPKIKFLHMLKKPFLSTNTYKYMSDMLQTQIGPDNLIECSKLLSDNELQQNYRFDTLLDHYNQDVVNYQFSLELNDIQLYIQKIQLVVITQSLVFLSPQASLNDKFKAIKFVMPGVIIENYCNEKLFRTQQIIGKNPSLQVIRIARTVELRLQQALGFSMALIRSHNLIMLCKSKCQSSMFSPVVKQIRQYFHEIIQAESVLVKQKDFISVLQQNQQQINILNNSLEQIDLILYPAFQQIDFASVMNGDHLEYFTPIQRNDQGLIIALTQDNETLTLQEPVTVITDEVLAQNLLYQKQKAQRLLSDGNYQEYLQNTPYQFIVHTLVFLHPETLKKLLPLIPNIARTKITKQAITSRVNENLSHYDKFQTAYGSTSKYLQKIFFEPSHWLGEAKPEETYEIPPFKLEITENLIFAMKTSTPILLKTDRIFKYDVKEFALITRCVSRFLGQKFVILTFSEYDTPEFINKSLTAFLNDNYIVYIAGCEFLQQKQIVEIQFVSGLLKNQGGSIVIFVPTQALNVSNELQDTDQTAKITSIFTDSILISVPQPIADMADQAGKEYGKCFNFVICCLSGMDCPGLSISDISFILARCQSQSAVNIAKSTLCFLEMQSESNDLVQSYQILVASAFGLEISQISYQVTDFKPVKQYTELSAEGCFTYELFQFYVRLGSVAIISPAQQLASIFIQKMYNQNNWTPLWVFSQDDIDLNYKQLIDSETESVLIFVFQDIDGDMAKSLFKNLVNLHCYKQPIQLSDGRFINLPKKPKIVVLVNSLKGKQITNTPLSLVQRRIKFDQNMMSIDFSLQQFIEKPLKLDSEFFQLKKYDEFKDTNLEDYKFYVEQLYTVKTDQQIAELDKNQRLIDLGMKLVKKLTMHIAKICYVEAGLNLDLRSWKILRSILSLFYFVVGIAQLSDYQYKEMVSTVVPDKSVTEFPLSSYQIPHFTMSEDRFQFYDFNFKSEFLYDRLDQESILNALTLAVVAGVINAFFPVMVWIGNADYKICKKVFDSVILALTADNELITELQIPLKTQQFLKSFAFPQSHLSYICLQTNDSLQIQKHKTDTIDDFTEFEPENHTEKISDTLSWTIFDFGVALLNNPVINKMTNPSVNFELPVSLSPKMSCAVPLIAGAILAGVPFAIIGDDKSGKSTLIRAALALVPGFIDANFFALAVISDFREFINKTLQRNVLRADNNIHSPNSRCQSYVIRMVNTNQELQGPLKLDQYSYFLGQKLILAHPSGYERVKFDNFYHSMYSGKTSMPIISIIVESSMVPKSIADSQLLCFQVEELSEIQMKKLIRTADTEITDQFIDEFIIGLSKLLPLLPIGFYEIISEMRRCAIYTTKEDKQMTNFSLSLFLNALRSLPQIQSVHMLKVMDEIKTAICVKMLSQDSFWGGLDNEYMIKLSQVDSEKFMNMKISQYTEWEVEVLEMAREYADKYILTQTENDDSDSDEKEDEKPEIDEQKQVKKEKPKLDILQAQGKFKKQMVLNNKLTSVEPGIFKLYVQMYEQYCQQMDPTLCNRMLIMHLNLQQQLERNAQNLHYYFQALKTNNPDKIFFLENFKIPSFIFYSFQMPSGYYHDQIQLLATLGNYTISNQRLFAQINSKRLEDEASLGESSSDVSSATSSNSSSQSSQSSNMSSSMSTISQVDADYQHNIHGRRHRRMLIDVMTLLQSVTKDLSERQHQGRKKFDNQLTKALFNCVQQKGEIKAVGYAIRAAFCQSLGISPIVGLQDLRQPENIKITPGLKAHSDSPNIDFLIAQMAGLLDPTAYKETKNLTLQKLFNASILQEPIDVLVVVPLSQLYSNSAPQTMVSVIQLTQQDSTICELFTEQEFQVIQRLTALNFGFSGSLSVKQVLGIASRSFAISLVSDLQIVTNLLIPTNPVGRHAVVEQKLNAFLAGENDRLKLYPLFKMTKVPLLNLKKLEVPQFLLQVQQYEQYVEVYCRGLLAVFQFCEDHCNANYLALSLNQFGKIAIKIINKRIRRNVKFLNSVTNLVDTIKQIESNKSYSPQDQGPALQILNQLKSINTNLTPDVQRSISFIKNAQIDGICIAARIIFFPFINDELKNENLFEIGIQETLKMEKIANFSLPENSISVMHNLMKSLDSLESDEKLSFISDVTVNISGINSRLLGLFAEDLIPNFDFQQFLESGILQENYLSETICQLASQNLKIQFSFIHCDIVKQLVQMQEIYRSSENKVSVINCILQHDKFLEALKTGLEMKYPLLFMNFAAKNSPIENNALIQKISILTQSKITKRNQFLNLGKLRMKIPLALHRYRFYYSLDSEVQYEDLIKSGMANQQLNDASVVIRPQFNVFNTFQNILKTFNKPGRRIAQKEIVNKLSNDFKSFALKIDEREACLFMQLRSVFQQYKAQIFQLSFLFSETNQLKNFTQNQQNQIMNLESKIQEDLILRLKIFTSSAYNKKVTAFTDHIAEGITAILIFTAKVSYVHPPLAVVFQDNFTSEFKAFIDKKMQVSNSKNLKLELILNSLAFYLEKIVVLLPNKYQLPFVLLSYLYYSVPFGFAKLEDEFILKSVFLPTKILQQQHDSQVLRHLTYPENKLHPPVFSQVDSLKNSWMSFCSSLNFQRFSDWFTFFDENHSIFAKIMLQPSAFDAILGNYIYKLKNRAIELFPQDLIDQLQKLPISLPYNLQVPSNETIFSAMIFSIVCQKQSIQQIFKRYHEIIPISPNKALLAAQNQVQIKYTEFLQKFNIPPTFLSNLPSVLSQTARNSVKNSKTVLIFFDEGLQIPTVIDLIHKLEITEFASLIKTLNPENKQFLQNSILVDASSSVNQTLLLLIKLKLQNLQISHILWVLIPVQYLNRTGTTKFSQNYISQFTALYNPEVLYIQRPNDLISCFQHSMMVSSGLLLTQKLALQDLSGDVLRHLTFICMLHSIKMSRELEKVNDQELCFAVESLMLLIANKKLEFLHLSAQLPKMMQNYVKGKEIPLTDEMSKFLFMPDKITLFDIMTKFDSLAKFAPQDLPELRNQQFNLSVRSEFVPILRDFVTFCIPDDARFIFQDSIQPPAEVQKNPLKHLQLIPMPLQKFIENSLQSIDYEAHEFTSISDQIVEMRDDVIGMRGVCFRDVIGDMLFFLQIFNAQNIMKMPALNLKVVGSVFKPTKRALVSESGLEFVDGPAPFLIGYSDYRLRGAKINDELMLEDYNDDDFCQEHFLHFYVAEKVEKEIVNSLVGIKFCCRGALNDVKVYVNGGGGSTEYWRDKGVKWDIGYW